MILIFHVTLRTIYTCTFLIHSLALSKYAYPWPLIVPVRDRFASFYRPCSACACRLDFESGTFLSRRHYRDYDDALRVTVLHRAKLKAMCSNQQLISAYCPYKLVYV